jgi:hypothetical protein
MVRRHFGPSQTQEVGVTHLAGSERLGEGI